MIVQRHHEAMASRLQVSSVSFPSLKSELPLSLPSSSPLKHTPPQKVNINVHQSNQTQPFLSADPPCGSLDDPPGHREDSLEIFDSSPKQAKPQEPDTNQHIATNGSSNGNYGPEQENIQKDTHSLDVSVLSEDMIVNVFATAQRNAAAIMSSSAKESSTCNDNGAQDDQDTPSATTFVENGFGTDTGTMPHRDGPHNNTHAYASQVLDEAQQSEQYSESFQTIDVESTAAAVKEVDEYTRPDENSSIADTAEDSTNKSSDSIVDEGANNDDQVSSGSASASSSNGYSDGSFYEESFLSDVIRVDAS